MDTNSEMNTSFVDNNNLSADWIIISNETYASVSSNKCSSGDETNLEITNEDPDEDKLKMLLKDFNMECILKYLMDAKVTYKSLQYMQKEDLKEAIPPLGLRMEFREKLFAWKKKEFKIDDETMSLPSKIDDWLKNVKPPTNPSFASTTSNFSFGNKIFNTATLLNESSKGRSIIEYYRRNDVLTSAQRDEIISIIVEEAIRSNIALKVQDFPLLINDICSAFPNEKYVQEYYFIPRQGKTNASGKLYAKYKNKRSKKPKLDYSVSNQEADFSVLEQSESQSCTQSTQAAEID